MVCQGFRGPKHERQPHHRAAGKAQIEYLFAVYRQCQAERGKAVRNLPLPHGNETARLLDNKASGAAGIRRGLKERHFLNAWESQLELPVSQARNRVEKAKPHPHGRVCKAVVGDWSPAWEELRTSFLRTDLLNGQLSSGI